MIDIDVKWKLILPHAIKDQNVNVGSLDFNHDQTELAVCSGKKILVYRCSDGELLRQLKGHKSNVYSVSYSQHDNRLASGGADNCTIIWSKEGKGILKFSHSTSIQIVRYNPVEDILASCAIEDYGLWSAEGKRVKKYEVESKIMCAAWRPDGQILAIGLLSGKVALKDLHGNMRGNVFRDAPISDLTWTHVNIDTGLSRTTLVCGCWNKSIAFFDSSLEQEPFVCKLDAYPLSLSLHGSMSQFILVSTNEKSIYVYNHQGVAVSTIDLDFDWLHFSKGLTDKGQVACKDCNGQLILLDTKYRTLRCERNGVTAYSQGSTRVAVYSRDQQINTTIDTNGPILGLHIGRINLAIHLKSEILVYAISGIKSRSGKGLIYTHQIRDSFDKFAIIRDKVLLTVNKRLYLYNQQRNLVKMWTLPSEIKCVEVACENLGNERVLVGCKNGNVMEVIMTSAFPVEIFKLNVGVRTLATSCNSYFVGVVDQANHLQIYNRAEERFGREKIESVSELIFHSSVEGLYCYHSNGSIVIQEESSAAKVLGCEGTMMVQFSGSKIVTLYQEIICEKSVDLALIIEQHVRSKMFKEAFLIAKLGVGSLIWENLGYHSMLSLNMNVAECCFSNLGQSAMVSMVRRVKRTLKRLRKELSQELSVKLVASEIDIINGNFKEAGDKLVSIGEIRRATNMFMSLGMFRDARLIIPNDDCDERDRVLRKEAEWEEEMLRWDSASDLYVECKAFVQAVAAASNIGGKQGLERIYSIAKIIPIDDKEALNLCCNYLAKLPGSENQLKEILTKMGDYSTLMSLYVDSKAWLDVSKLRKEQEGNFDKTLILPYADWLALQGNLQDALDVNREAGREDRNFKLLSFFLNEARTQECYKKISELYFKSASIAYASNDETARTYFTDEPDLSAHEMKRLSILFYVYDQVIDHSFGIFPTCLPDNILQGCVFLIKSIKLSKVPKGISMSRLMTIFCALARSLGCYQSTRIGYDLLSRDLSLTEQQRKILNEDMMLIETSPMEDDVAHHTICSRCGSSQELLSKNCTEGADSCTTCLHPFIRCMISYDILPLIEFTPNGDLDQTEVIKTIQSAKANKNADSLFHDAVNSVLADMSTGYSPVEVDRETLDMFDRSDIYAIKCEQSGNLRFFRNMIPDIGVAICHHCNQFFHEEDFEYHHLKLGGCPVCKTQSAGNYGHI